MFGYGALLQALLGCQETYGMNAFIHALSRHLKSSEPQKPSSFQIPQRAARLEIQATLEVKAGFQILDLFG